jgi:hypothetical protein
VVVFRFFHRLPVAGGIGAGIATLEIRAGASNILEKCRI